MQLGTTAAPSSASTVQSFLTIIKEFMDTLIGPIVMRNSVRTSTAGYGSRCTDPRHLNVRFPDAIDATLRKR